MYVCVISCSLMLTCLMGRAGRGLGCAELFMGTKIIRREKISAVYHVTVLNCLSSENFGQRFEDSSCFCLSTCDHREVQTDLGLLFH